MAQEGQSAAQNRAWIVVQSDGRLGLRYPVPEGVTRIGRAPDNDVVIQGSQAASVSARHLEIRRNGSTFTIHDLESTNGTYLNGERIGEGHLPGPAAIRLGTQGPELIFFLDDSTAAGMDKTQVISPEAVRAATAETPALPSTGAYESLLTEAVERARQARAVGMPDQTMTIMRDAMDRALQHTGRRFRRAIVVLAAGLVAVSAGAAWKVSEVAREKRSIDERIRQLEVRLDQAAQSPAEADRLISELDAYEGQAEQLQQNLLYRVAVHEKQAFITNEIRNVMAEFGAEVYSVPPEFSERVKHYIEQYQGPDRPLVASALTDSAGKIRVMQRIFEQEHLPEDLAYIPLVESALTGAQASQAGAVGLWQFTPATAKAYGLRVDDQVDERKDLRKATRAGCRYLRDLILDFGSGSSVMLALAAYNLGPSKVKQAVTATVKDPIKQRSFWYLYRIKALPVETREYVPKVVAAIIVGRQPERFGF